MTISVEHSRLTTAISRISWATGSVKTLPIFGFAKLQIVNGNLTLTVNDMDNSATALAPLANGGAIPPICVNVKALSEAIKPLKGKLIEIEYIHDDGAPLLKVGSRTLFALPANDFPEAPHCEAPISGVVINSAVYRELHQKVAFAVSDEATRYYLNGFHLEHDGDGFHAIATNGRVLSHYNFPASLTGKWENGIIPTNLMDGILKVIGKKGDDDITISRQGGAPRVLIGIGGHTFVNAKLVDATFPDWRRVLPRDLPISFTTDRADLLSAFQSVKIGRGGHSVRVGVFSTHLTLMAKQGDVFTEAKTDAESTTEYYFGVNVTYAVDALSALSGDIVIWQACDPDKHGVAGPMSISGTNANHQIVVVPIRV